MEDEQKEIAHLRAIILRLKKGADFCQRCNGSGWVMNRNGYSEYCFGCKGYGIVDNLTPNMQVYDPTTK